MATIQREVRKRTFMGKLVKWVFILFNLLMAIWLFSYWGSVGSMIDGAASDAEKAGGAIGATLGTGMLMSIWFFGAVILGMFVMFTRGNKVIITDEQ